MPVAWRSIAIVLVFFWGEWLHAAAADDLTPKQPLSTPPFYKTSFECAKSRFLSTEEAICKNEQLANLDIELSAAYKKQLAMLTASERTRLRKNQRDWLALRNAYDVNPYHGDPPGLIADITDLYRNRISALRSEDSSALNVTIPDEYAWLRATAEAGFNKGFSLGRTYMGCSDPCEKAPSSYRWISIWGRGLGDEPGDISTPYNAIVKKLVAEGWAKCRSVDDSSKPTIDYFSKGDKIVEISRYYSMGVGNSIIFGVTTSGPLQRYGPQSPPNPQAVVGSDWETYTIAALGLKLRYPPRWHVRDMSSAGSENKLVMFGANDFTANFTIKVRPQQRANHWSQGMNDEEPEVSCTTSPYKISGLPTEQCVTSGEQIGDGICWRNIYSEAVSTSNYALRFEPDAGTVSDVSGSFRLTNLYEKILGTIEIQDQ